LENLLFAYLQSQPSRAYRESSVKQSSLEFKSNVDYAAGTLEV